MLSPGKKYYISERNGSSGISRYASDFHRLVLKDLGYAFIDSALPYQEIFSTISSRDEVHIEIGIFQRKEVEILMRMLNASYRHLHVTLHDAPLVKYPFHEFRIPLLNQFSKFYDVHWDNFSSLGPLVRKIKKVFVLSHKGAAAVRATYHSDNVHYLPHIVDPEEITNTQDPPQHMIFFGFIGPNKGIEYALKIHERMIQLGFPDLKFYVVGTPIGKNLAYYEQLKMRFRNNVIYCGYVPDNQLSAIFDQAGFAVQPFQDYSFFHPFSGSVLQLMKKGKIVFTSNVNTVSEIVQDGQTGFFLTGQLNRDTMLISHVIANKDLQRRVIQKSGHLLARQFSPKSVLDHLLLVEKGQAFPLRPA